MQVEEAKAVLEDFVSTVSAALERETTGRHDDLLDRVVLHRDGLQNWPKLAEALQTLRRHTIVQITAPGPRGWGWSQAALARELGISRSRVNQMLRDGDEDDEYEPLDGSYPPDVVDAHGNEYSVKSRQERQKFIEEIEQGGSVSEWDQPLPLNV